MRKFFLLICFTCIYNYVTAQTPCPCGGETYRKFDFWIGEWDVYAKNNQKAGDSKITLILDSCIVLEEWTSAGIQQGVRYAGKSFNTYNAQTGQWQQTWVDNVAGSTEYLKGKAGDNNIVFETQPFKFKNDTMAIRRLSFFKLSNDKVRQLGELSKDNGTSWITEYDLEYRRRANDADNIIQTLFKKMEDGYNTSNHIQIAGCYAENGKVVGPGVMIDGKEKLITYWKELTEMGGTWKLTNKQSQQINDDTIWENGISVITDKNGRKSMVDFTLLLIFENGSWKIAQDAYWFPN